MFGRLIVFAPFLIIIESPKQRLDTYYKHELPVAAMFVNGSGRNEQSL
jgi:hypothetical protein